MEKLGITGKSIAPMVLMSLEDKPINHLIRAKRFYKQNIHVDTHENKLYRDKKDKINRKKHNKDKIYNKLQSESLFFKQCHKLKNLLF